MAPVSNPPDPKLAAAIHAIWERAFSTVHRELEAIDKAVVELQRGCLEEPTRAAAEAAAHKIAGSAGTFGFTEASRVAREIEDLVQVLTPEHASALTELAVSLRMHLLASGGPPGAEGGT